jgi:hypothetical protein
MMTSTEGVSIGSDGQRDLTISLCHTLDLVLLLDGVAVGGATGCVNYLVRQALRNGFNVSECGLTRTLSSKFYFYEVLQLLKMVDPLRT